MDELKAYEEKLEKTFIDELLTKLKDRKYIEVYKFSFDDYVRIKDEYVFGVKQQYKFLSHLFEYETGMFGEITFEDRRFHRIKAFRDFIKRIDNSLAVGINYCRDNSTEILVMKF